MQYSLLSGFQRSSQVHALFSALVQERYRSGERLDLTEATRISAVTGAQCEYRYLLYCSYDPLVVDASRPSVYRTMDIARQKISK